jgi:hypothetical protein
MSAGRTIISQSQEWGTPQKYIIAVKKVFGGKIDLDPCSNAHSVVDAEVEYHLRCCRARAHFVSFVCFCSNPIFGCGCRAAAFALFRGRSFVPE